MPSIQPIQKKAFLSHVLFNNIRSYVDDLFAVQPNPSLVVEPQRRIIHGVDRLNSTHEIMASWLSDDTGVTVEPDQITVELAYNGAVSSSITSQYINMAICLYDNSTKQWPFYIAPVQTQMPVPGSSQWQKYAPRPNQVVMWDQSTHWARREPFTGKCHLTLNLRFKKI